MISSKKLSIMGNLDAKSSKSRKICHLNASTVSNTKMTLSMKKSIFFVKLAIKTYALDVLLKELKTMIHLDLLNHNYLLWMTH